jgi:hypothetical protein
VHIFAGFTALTAAVVATLTKTLDIAHRWHVYSGTVFFWGFFQRRGLTHADSCIYN